MVTFEQSGRTWYKIHKKASKIKTYEDKEDFKRYMKRLYRAMDCEVCKSHTKKFIKSHPMRDYWTYIDEDGKDRGLFRWTWIFHNDVNKRLGKREYKWHETVRLYYK